MTDASKNILITPNSGVATVFPKIEFTGFDANTLTLSVLDDGTLSVDGSTGQLFSVSDSFTGTIFSVNDISGIPSIEVLDDGTVKLAEFGGDVTISGNVIGKIAQVRNSATIANVNGTTGWTNVAVTGITDYMDDGFVAGATGIVCNFTGRVKVTVHLYMDIAGAEQRAAPKIKAAVAGVGGPIIGATGYLRNNVGDHTNSSCTAVAFFDVVSGNEVTLQSAQGSTTTGVVTGVIDACMILIERV
jgi:hypothetical protein